MQRQAKIPNGNKHIRYKAYMYANLLKDGDYHDVFGYKIWLSKRLQEFRDMKGLERFDSFDFHGLQGEFDDYLIKYAEKERLEAQGQTNIFEFVGGTHD